MVVVIEAFQMGLHGLVEGIMLHLEPPRLHGRVDGVDRV
jgi:hypothetical protein